MDILWFLVIGLIAGILAKAIVPGTSKEPKGCLLTIALGIVGSVLVGFIMRSVLGANTSNSFIGSIIGATIGAIVLILLMRKFWK